MGGMKKVTPTTLSWMNREFVLLYPKIDGLVKSRFYSLREHFGGP